MKHKSVFSTSLIIMFVDALLFLGIFHFAWYLRSLLTPLIGFPVQFETITALIRLAVFFLIAIFLLLEQYPGFGILAVQEIEGIARGTTLVFIVLAGISFLNRDFLIFSRLVLLIAWLLSLGILPLGRLIVRNLLSKQTWYGVPVIIFGDQPWVDHVAESLARITRLGWQVKQIYSLDRIEQYEGNQHEIAILAPSSRSRVNAYTRHLQRHFRRVILVHERNNFGSIYVIPRDLDGQLGLEFQYHLLTNRAKWTKIIIDFVGGGIIFLLLSPIFIMISIVIWFDSGWPIIYMQKRFGQNFKEFNVYKFRTMIVDADEKLAELLQSDPETCAAYEKYHKIHPDPRVTRVGTWLRRFSLDELPQILNIIKGDMSLVGPRAYMVSEHGEMGVHAAIILRVKPGMTGWWQVLGRHNTTFEQRLLMDEHYISNWSIWMDFYILFRTIWVVIRGSGT